MCATRPARCPAAVPGGTPKVRELDAFGMAVFKVKQIFFRMVGVGILIASLPVRRFRTTKEAGLPPGPAAVS